MAKQHIAVALTVVFVLSLGTMALANTGTSGVTFTTGDGPFSLTVTSPDDFGVVSFGTVSVPKTFDITVSSDTADITVYADHMQSFGYAVDCDDVQAGEFAVRFRGLDAHSASVAGFKDSVNIPYDEGFPEPGVVPRSIVEDGPITAGTHTVSLQVVLGDCSWIPPNEPVTALLHWTATATGD